MAEQPGLPARVTVYTPFRWVWLARSVLRRRHPTYWLPPAGAPSWCAGYRAKREPGVNLWRRWRWEGVR